MAEHGRPLSAMVGLTGLNYKIPLEVPRQSRQSDYLTILTIFADFLILFGPWKMWSAIAPNGAGSLSPANQDLAIILGRMDLYFELSFHFLILLDS